MTQTDWFSFRASITSFFNATRSASMEAPLKAWGHAISPDLVHWREADVALMPDRLGSIWSGSAVVDSQNTTGFQTGTEPPLVAIYTTAGGMLPDPKTRNSRSPSPTAMTEVGRGKNITGILFSNILQVGIAIRRSSGMDLANNGLWLSIWTAIGLHSWPRAT